MAYILDIQRDEKGRFLKTWAKHRIKVSCKTCKKGFETIESRIKVGKGKFCSKKCYFKNGVSQETKEKFSKQRKGKHFSKETEFKYTNGNGYRHLLLKGLLPQKCSLCNEKKITRLHVHHKDKNRKNNSINNLDVLCRKHHLKKHNKIERNYVEGRKII